MADIRVAADNSKEVLSALERAKRRGLEAIGLTAELHAKEKLSEEVYVDDPDRTWILTGRLRNSITYALSGESAHITTYTYSGGEQSASGVYEGMAPEDKDVAVYIGTNVEYAAGIELGTHRKKGAVHFLQSAAADHKSEYKNLLEESIKNA